MTSKTSLPSVPANPMTAADAARIQSVEAKKKGGSVDKGSFAARATRVATKGGKR